MRSEASKENFFFNLHCSLTWKKSFSALPQWWRSFLTKKREWCYFSRGPRQRLSLILTWVLSIQIPWNLQISKPDISGLQLCSEMKVTCSGCKSSDQKYFDCEFTECEAQVKHRMFLPFTCSQCCCFGIWLFCLQIFQKDRKKKKRPFFPSWRKYSLSKETFKLPANSQGYGRMFCNKVPSENRLAAALILRTAGFLGCGENEMVQLIEVMTEPRWVNYLDVLSSHPEYGREEKCQGLYFPLWQQTAAELWWGRGAAIIISLGEW